MHHKIVENAHFITYGSATSGILVGGLHLGDISAIVSILGVICGVVLQIYAFTRRNQR